MADGKYGWSGPKDHGVAPYRLCFCRRMLIPHQTLDNFQHEAKPSMKAIQIGLAIALLVGAFLLATQIFGGQMMGDREKKATREMSSELDKAIEAQKEDMSKRRHRLRGIP